MKCTTSEVFPGALVTIPLPRKAKPLDGFWLPGYRRHAALLVIVHGMGGNFYRSSLKKEWLRQADRFGFDVFTCNNRGSDRAVVFERFGDCVADIDAALAVGRRLGYRRFVLLGHSTGCQKVTLYQSRRQNPDVRALALAAPADDLAICRRDLGKRYKYWLKHARQLVAQGQGKTLLPMLYEKFSARRFLGIADPRSTEAQLFNYAGRLHHFSRIHCPVLAFLGTREEYACLPVAQMDDILRAKTRSQNFHFFTVPGGDHGFHGHEQATVQRALHWLRTKVK
jgi:pimeloyl-ACP methyl ester carboxylesterase